MGGCATAEGPPQSGARAKSEEGKSEESELPVRKSVNAGLRQHLAQGINTEHIAQVQEEIVDAGLAVQHRNPSQAFSVIDAEIFHLSELRADGR